MHAVILLALFWGLSAVIGWGIAPSLLVRSWVRERGALAPVFGAGFLILATSLLSYAGWSMRTAAPVAAGLGLALAVAGVSTSRHGGRRPWQRGTIAVQSLGALAAVSTLTSVLLYRGWHPYTDAFTYLSIADYLQTHGFFPAVTLTPSDPLLTQIWTYQRFGYRMGSTFFLAFATGLIRAEYAFDVYPSAVALGVWLGVPAFWVLARRGLLCRPRTALLAAVLYGLHTGIPLANAIWGFMPQAWGLAFLYPFLALHMHANAADSRRRSILAAGFLAGLLLLTYVEIVPFALVVSGTSWLVRLWRHRRPRLAAAFLPLVLGAMIAPVASWTMVRTLAQQITAVVGWDVGFSLGDYLVVVAGYRSIVQNLTTLGNAASVLCWAGGLAAAATMAFAAWRGPRRTVRQVAMFGAVFAAAFVWFRVAGANPWQPDLAGQPWSAYKVVTYGFFLLPVLWAVGLRVLWRLGGGWRTATVVQVAAFLAFFPFATWLQARIAVATVQRFTGAADPIAAYHRIPMLVQDLPPDLPVNLVISSPAHKHREFVAYFLRRPVIADWSDDEYVTLPVPGTWPDPRYPTLLYAPGSPRASVAGLERLDPETAAALPP